MIDQTFESFCPKLRPGRLIPKGSQLLYETSEPFDQIIVPIELTRLLVLCNGNNSLRDIISELYKEKAGIRFRHIYNTIVEFHNRGFLENADDLPVGNARIHANGPRDYYSVREVFRFYIVKRLFNDQTHPLMFYFLSMIVLIAAISSFRAMPDLNELFKYIGSQISLSNMVISLFCVFSIFLTGKYLFKGLLLLLATGRIYNIEVVFNGFAGFLRIGSESSYLVVERLFSVLLSASTMLIYFLMAFIGSQFFQGMVDPNLLWITALILFVNELNPFSSNELSQLFRYFYQDEALIRIERYFGKNSLVQSLHIGGQLWGKFFKFSFLALAYLWTVIVFAGIFSYGSHIGLYLKHVLFWGHWSERIFAFVLATVPLAVGLMLAINIFWMTYRLLGDGPSRLKRYFQKLNWARSIKSRPFEELAPILEELPLFSYFRSSELQEIIEHSHMLSLKPGDTIIKEGQQGQELFVLLGGELSVFKMAPEDKKLVIGEIHPISIFGEWAVLGNETRGASVESATPSTVLEVPGQLIKAIAEKSQNILEMDQFLKSIMLSQFFSSAPMFRDLPAEIITMFTSKGKIENVAAKKVMARQGHSGNGFYLILRGAVIVMVNGKQVSQVGQGGFFGEIAALADIPATATIVTKEDCVLFRISHSSLWELFAENIEMAMVIESIAEKRLIEDIESLEFKPAQFQIES